MSDSGDSQNTSAHESVDLDASTSTDESIFYDGERSSPSDLPKATRRTRKQKDSDEEDEDFHIEEVSSKKKATVVRKEYDGQQTKRGADKFLASAAAPETMTFTLEEPSGSTAGRNKKRTSKTTAIVVSRGATMHVDPHEDAQAEEEEEEAAQQPPPVKQ